MTASRAGWTTGILFFFFFLGDADDQVGPLHEQVVNLVVQRVDLLSYFVQ
jgi:hypothetical protein